MRLTKFKPVDPKPGIYDDVPWEEYVSWNCFSKSMTQSAMKSMAHLHHYIHGPGLSTQAMSFGSLVDTIILEPEMFHSRYKIRPTFYEKSITVGRGNNKKVDIVEKPWNMNSKTCKGIVQDARDNGLELVSESDVDRAIAMKVALLENDNTRDVIKDGMKQVSLCWIDESTGVKCKCRFDVFHSGIIYDLKTTRDASPDGFRREIGRHLYHVQAGAYTSAYKAITGKSLPFRFIAVETSGETENPEFGLYEMTEESILAGLMMFRRALRKFMSSESVIGYSPYWESIEAPRWMLEAELREDDEECQI